MSQCTLEENVTGTCSTCERELARLKAIESAARRAVAITSSSSPVVMSPAQLCNLQSVALGELVEALEQKGGTSQR